MPGRWVEIGRTFSVNPARRELRIRATGAIDEFRELSWIHVLLEEGRAVRCRVDSVAIEQNEARLGLGPGTPRDTVALMKGRPVVREQAAASECSGDAFHAAPMLGYSVRDAAGGNIGTVAGVFDAPAHPVLEIERGDGTRLLLPAIPEVIVQVDADRRALIVADIGPYAVEETPSGKGGRHHED